MKLITDLQYFAPGTFFYELSKYSHCYFDQYEEYRKMSFRNRCTLLGANGKIDLSIPLVGGRSQRTLMKDVKIDHREDWRARHWKTITSCYNKSPWLEYYKDELESLFSYRPEFLMDWNMRCFQWVYDKMSINTTWSLTDQYRRNYDENVVKDWRGYLTPATIDSKVTNGKRYTQVFEDRFGFVSNLSILDYLFCSGNRL